MAEEAKEVVVAKAADEDKSEDGYTSDDFEDDFEPYETSNEEEAQAASSNNNANGAQTGVTRHSHESLRTGNATRSNNPSNSNATNQRNRHVMNLGIQDSPQQNSTQ